MAVERSRWTDERLDDLSERVVRHDALTDRVDDLVRGVEGLRQEISSLRQEMVAMRTELSGQINAMRSELYSTRRWALTMWLGFAGLFVEIALLK
jgi:hypothetical protein